jgi:D-alanine-D-alanine ligase
MTKALVGVLRGGPSHEYDVSLNTGATFMSALDEDRYAPIDIFVDKAGDWYRAGKRMDPLRAVQSVDVVLNGMHGSYGEDGTVQRILERASVPFVGSRSLGASLSIHKPQAAGALRAAGVLVPISTHVTTEDTRSTSDMARDMFMRVAPPYVVKPAFTGSSVGVLYVPTVRELPAAIAATLEAYGSALVEEYVMGREASVGVINNFRDQDVYALPPVEIVHQDRVYHYDAKYGDARAKLYAPSTFSHPIKAALEAAAKKAHDVLGLAHYSRSDFKVHPSGKIYYLETNALPTIAAGTVMPKALESVGATIPYFTEHVLSLATV